MFLFLESLLKSAKTRNEGQRKGFSKRSRCTDFTSRTNESTNRKTRSKFRSKAINLTKIKILWKFHSTFPQVAFTSLKVLRSRNWNQRTFKPYRFRRLFNTQCLLLYIYTQLHRLFLFSFLDFLCFVIFTLRCHLVSIVSPDEISSSSELFWPWEVVVWEDVENLSVWKWD